MLSNKLDKKFDELTINNKAIELKDGSRYIGKIVNEGKGIRYVYNSNKYVGEFKMVRWKEKAFIIIMGIVIDMNVILKMVKEKEKEFIIILMAIEKWAIF